MNNKPASCSPFVTKDDMNRVMLDLVSSFQSAITKALEEQARSLLNLVRQICSTPPSPVIIPKTTKKLKLPHARNLSKENDPMQTYLPQVPQPDSALVGTKIPKPRRTLLVPAARGKRVDPPDLEKMDVQNAGPTGSDPIKDAALKKLGVHEYLRYEVVLDLHDSDHHPIIIDVNLNLKPLPSRRTTVRWNQVLKSLTADGLPFNNYREWWNSDCSFWQGKKRRFLRLVRKRISQEAWIHYKKCASKLRKIIKAAKKKFWEKISEEGANSSSIYRIIKSLQNRQRVNCSANNVMGINGVSVPDPFVQANCLAELYRTEKVSGGIPFSLAGEEGAWYNLPLSLSELQIAIKSLRISSPGHDGIGPTFIKMLNPASVASLLDIFNASNVPEKHIYYEFRVSCNLSIASTFGGARSKFLINIINSTIRSSLEYGCQVFITTNKTDLSKLEVIYNQGLRFACGLPKWTPIPVIFAEANEPPLKTRIQFLAENELVELSMVTAAQEGGLSTKHCIGVRGVLHEAGNYDFTVKMADTCYCVWYGCVQGRIASIGLRCLNPNGDLKLLSNKK
ncbi:hypothetical protein JTE90_023182 [Oedothorax gibbosus]|uniref:Uncharacterized protein n=1 Tax=Oedothorax gibbosus TaxID=931172 RepID=A0AAV6UGU0_9ARAC|nr:hypothetical protein JTE90_023182 [Oedothorax gibbosus]